MKPPVFSCTVLSLEKLSPTAFQLVFEPDQHPLEFAAGQFISILVPEAGLGGKDLERPYSLASPPERRPFELCIKQVDLGPGSSFLARLQPGARFTASGPEGEFVYFPKKGRDAVFLATGTAIAPYRSIFLSRAFRDDPPRSATCVLGARSEEELLYVDELSRLPGLQWIPTLTQPGELWMGAHGRVTTWVRALPPEFPWRETDFYICGSGPMITEIKTILALRNVPTDAIHHEKFY